MASTDKNLGAFLLFGSPQHTTVPTLLPGIPSSGKKEQFEENINSILLDRKRSEEFFLSNIAVSVFKIEFHNRNCAKSTQWKTNRLPAFLTNNHHLPFPYSG